jgi:putative ABC transport system permease protein
MILLLSWKNIWRSKRRSAIIIAAIALGLWGGLFAYGVMEGMADTMVNSAIDRDMMHLQIHAPGFRDDRSLAQAIPTADSLVDVLRRAPGVFAVVERELIDGMAVSPLTSRGVRIVGIDPEREAAATSMKKSIVAGDFLTPAGRGTPVVIGKALADKLELHLHGKIVLTFQSLDGTILSGAFRIVGIYTTFSSQFDEAMVFVRQHDLDDLSGRRLIHEIAVRLDAADSVGSFVHNFRQQHPGLECQGWKELSPELKITAESTGISMMIFLGIILLALTFGITNTMLMAVLDRVREFGMLMAVGMMRRRLFALILTETLFLSLTGGIIGMVLGLLTILVTHDTGIDLSVFSQGLSYYGIPSMLYPVVPWQTYVSLALMIVITSLCAALYPALKAVRLNPVTAIRTQN